jgi:hypothetical protein
MSCTYSTAYHMTAPRILENTKQQLEVCLQIDRFCLEHAWQDILQCTNDLLRQRSILGCYMFYVTLHWAMLCCKWCWNRDEVRNSTLPSCCLCRRFRRIAKRDLPTSCFLPHGTSGLPLYGFSWNLVFGFSKICRENPSFIKIWQEWRVIYMKTYVHLW